MLYYTIPYHTILYYTMLHYATLYYNTILVGGRHAQPERAVPIVAPGLSEGGLCVLSNTTYLTHGFFKSDK